MTAFAEAAHAAYLQRVADCLDGADLGTDAADLFARAAPLDLRQVAYLVDRVGVPAMALQADGDGIGWPLLTARVELVGGRAPRFAWRPEDGASALVTVLRGEDGQGADVAALSLREGWIASFDGVLAFAGEHDIATVDVEGPVTLHADGAAWLRAGRLGLAILDPRRAYPVLRDLGAFVVDDFAFGDRLQRVLTVKPRVLVREAA